MPRDELLAEEVAALAGIKRATFYSYINRTDPISGEPRPTAPQATRQVGTIKLWDRAVIEDWLATRPGRGRVTPGRERKARVNKPKDES